MLDSFFSLSWESHVGVTFNISFHKSQHKVSLNETLSMVLQFQYHSVFSGSWGKAGILH